MRVTIAHKRTKAEVIENVDRSFDKMFQGVGVLPVQFIVDQKSWQGSICTFALTAKMGTFATPIKGFVEVTDTDVTVDADLGILNRFISDETAREVIGKRVKGLLT